MQTTFEIFEYERGMKFCPNLNPRNQNSRP